MLWDEKDFLKWIKNNDPDGAVVVYESEDPKNSFAKINKLGLIEDFAEKKQSVQMLWSDFIIGKEVETLLGLQIPWKTS